MEAILQRQVLKKMLESFSKEPEIYKIYSFGSLNSGLCDRYSDIDLNMVVNDFGGVIQKLEKLFSDFGSIEAILTLDENNENVVYSIFLENHLPYHKVDLGIYRSDNKLFSNMKLEYESTSSQKFEQSKVVSRLEKVVDHQMLDCFIGSIRYLKYVFRDELWVAYKFYRAFVEQFLRVRLNIDDQLQDTELFKKFNNYLGNDYIDMIYSATQKQMNENYMRYLDEYLSLVGHKITKENRSFAEKVIDFWHKELDVYSRGLATK